MMQNNLKAIASRCEFGYGLTLDLALTSDRPTLIPAFSGPKKLCYGPPTSYVVVPPSSGKID